MPRHVNYVPHGVIPAVLLPFDNDLAIDEASFRKHLRGRGLRRRPLGHHRQRATRPRSAPAVSRSSAACSTSRRTRSGPSCR